MTPTRLSPGRALPAVAAALALFAAGCASDPQVGSIGEKVIEEHSASVPDVTDRLRLQGWVVRHSYFNEISSGGRARVVFLGDSITEGWEKNGRQVWASYYEPRKAVNFGISGDRTEHVLWRVSRGGNFGGLSPRLTVLNVGTNNLDYNSPGQVADGIAAIVKELRLMMPATPVLVMGIFPRGEQPSDPYRARIAEVNARVAKLADGESIIFRDIGEEFLQPDGSISKDVMYDFLHLTPKGYEIWAQAIEEDVAAAYARK